MSGGSAAQADVVLALEAGDISNVARQARQRNAKVVSITAQHLFQRSNYQDFQRYAEVDMSIAADAEASLPALIEEIRRLTTDARREAFRQRGERIAEANRRTLEQARVDASHGWDASPVSTARLSMELWAELRKENWSYVTGWVNWPLRLWDFTQHHQYIGRAGAEGVGYYAPASVGAALASELLAEPASAVAVQAVVLLVGGTARRKCRRLCPLGLELFSRCGSFNV